KNVDTEKLNESLNEIKDQFKKIDTTELKDAVDKLAGALPEELVQGLKNETKKEEVKVDPKAVEEAKNNTDISYATADYTGIDKDDYYEWLPEDDMPAKGKIMEVLAADFPEYEVREDVSPTLIGGTGKFLDYTLGVFKDNEPKLFIMVLDGRNDRRRTYRWSKEQAQKAGITMINFIEKSPNRYWYISERLHKYL
ncbi:MAG: hypothetical protein IKX97_04740, partial [Erysipelotrichaceae bacterium]|nr:hypothetical protein [Erysipelotrichaceae bacterium]